jgi:predicted cupin superfamily sugar epimerase
MTPLARRLIALLDLQPLAREGGHFRRTWTSEQTLRGPCLGGRYEGSRPCGTAIYYLLTAESFSALHRLPGAEVYHFYLGDPVELILLRPDGTGERLRLGSDVLTGEQVQTTVPGGVWQGSRLLAGGAVALMGTTMAPGFDEADLEIARRADLLETHPQWATAIRRLTAPRGRPR